MKKKTYTVYQKSVQTDCYEIEAESAEDALRVYKSSPGEIESSGSTGGWYWGDCDVVVGAADSRKALARDKEKQDDV